MRIVIAIVAFVGVCITLQGCGSSGSSCTNSHADFVTQSFTADVAGTAGNKSKSKSITGQATVKIDVSTGNVRINYDGHSGNNTISMKLIVNVEKKLVVTKIVVNTSAGEPLTDKCEKKDLPQASLIPAALQQLRIQMQQSFKCGGKDGTFDTWKYAFHAKDPQDPVHPGRTLPGDFSLDTELHMDKDFLLHSGKATVSAQPDKGGAESAVQSSQTLTVTQGPSSQGPTAADLNEYLDWGHCKSPDQLHAFKEFDTNLATNLIVNAVQNVMALQKQELVV